MKFTLILILVFTLIYSPSSYAMAQIGGGFYVFLMVVLALVGLILLLLWMKKFLQGIKKDCKQDDEKNK